MKKNFLILLVFSLLFTTNIAFAENIFSETISSFDISNEKNYITYDLETQSKSTVKIKDTTHLGNKKFVSPERKGHGELEKFNIKNFIDPKKTTIDPLTGKEIGNTNFPYAIIGPDDRHKVQNTSIMPYRAQSYIQFENLTSGWSCSGGVISDDLVVTNAHCVDRKILRATVLPGVKDSSFSYGFYRVTQIMYPKEYKEGASS
ncbi:trypsin-like serine protease [Virgibacillus pantothenticus]|uniref:trypsin-like serine protease n=1 Tax=Virgibacillus pantothenticus TaxID=1473 RepID=UPI000986474A|nr:trypsin-like serine protease [Virgibacillus pantothenticus]